MAEIYVYRNVNSTGARDLANALGGKRVKVEPPVRHGDFVICWGSSMDKIGRAGVKFLNANPINNKYEDALELKRKGVKTIEVSLRRGGHEVAIAAANARVEVPNAPPPDNIRNLFNSSMELANDFVENDNPNLQSPVFIRGVNEFRVSLNRFADALGVAPRGAAELRVQAAPAPIVAPQGEWLGRRFHHVGGKDLLGLNKNPAQYYVKKEAIVEEYRIHCFLGKSIRAGRKVVRPDVPRPHAWIRSWDGGWKMDYADFKSTKVMRELAAAATSALGLDFGGVDIGKKADGSLMVLEVNRAPGIEGGTIDAYKRAIEGWMAGA